MFDLSPFGERAMPESVTVYKWHLPGHRQIGHTNHAGNSKMRKT